MASLPQPAVAEGPSGDGNDAVGVALPQRQPRAKRRRVNAGEAELAQQGEAAAAAAQPQGEEQGGGAAAASEQPGAGEGSSGDATPAAAQLPLQEYRSAAVPGFNFEYLDHTADVQLHAWGADLREAFEQVGLAMFNYMTPLSGIAVDEAETRSYEAEAHDLQSLLFQFLDELLFTFSTEFFVCKELRITGFDREAWRITAEGQGERFDRTRHACGTEIKAITYSAMQINETEGDAEVFVIVDI